MIIINTITEGDTTKRFKRFDPVKISVYSFKERLLHLIKVLVSPSNVFNDLVNKGFSLGLNGVLILILNFILSFHLSSILVKSPEILEVFPEELKSNSAFFIFSLFMAVISIFQLIFTVIISSTVYLLIYKLFKFDINFKQLFVIVFLSQIPPLIGKSLNTIFMNQEGNNIPISSLAYPFYSGDMQDAVLVNVLSYVEFFNIWSLIITAIGIAIAAKKSLKNSFGIMTGFLIITAIITSVAVSFII